jgi:hypothetical protein
MMKECSTFLAGLSLAGPCTWARKDPSSEILPIPELVVGLGRLDKCLVDILIVDSCYHR